MAVSRMKRIQILAHDSTRNDVVAALRNEGVLHVTSPSIELEAIGDGETRRKREHEIASELGKLEYVRNFLKPYYVPSKKGMEKMFNPKFLLDEEELRATVDSFSTEARYQSCVALEGRMRSAEAEIVRKTALATEVAHWADAGVDVDAMVDTRLTRIAPLTVEAGEFEKFRTSLEEAVPDSEFLEVSRSGATVYLVIMYLKEMESDVALILKRHSARWADLSGAAGEPKAAAERLLDEATGLSGDIESMKEEATELALDYETILLVHDDVAERLAKESVHENFGSTGATFVVEGWMRSRDEERVRERLDTITTAIGGSHDSPDASPIHMATRDPEPGEDVPVDLNNSGMVSPFEFVTTLYSRPVYWENDPTPLLAPFFIIFFGLCVSDGGYGITLALVALWLMSKMPHGGARQFMKLLLMGGISTTVVGLITGGWFGIDPNVMPAFIQNAIVLNPLQEPMKMLNVVFIIGIVQVFTGLAIKMIADYKAKRWLDAILDQLLWIVFLSFLVPLGYDFILGGYVPPGIAAIAGRGAQICGVLVILTGARKNANPVMKLLGGVLKLYDIVGYFGDVLSYARLLALGLATGAIAMAINGIAEMAMEIPVAGPIGAVLILIAGHLFNLAVNCLGGFVHSARLQYLEYFAKFFTGGGHVFQPFASARRYSEVRRQES
ncbi:V-type ATP synthase subunit I [bacterium]|nr:V-type ATP synthase subunit I [bacterium]